MGPYRWACSVTHGHIAIEEQFYLVWPIILIVLLRGIQHRLLLTAVVSARCRSGMHVGVLRSHSLGRR